MSITVREEPLATEQVFENATGELGALWKKLCDVENSLASKLLTLPAGTAASSGEETWTLRSNGSKLVLVHLNAALSDCTPLAVSYAQSRFDYQDDWMDVKEADLQRYIDAVQLTIESGVYRPYVEQDMKP